MSDLPIFVFNLRTINDVSMTSDITSDIIDISEVSGYVVHAIWTGSPVGNLAVQGSNTLTSSDFVDVYTQAVGGVAGKILMNVEKVHYRYIRIFYDATSSTGTLNVYASAKRN